jgi:hypothetical protein
VPDGFCDLVYILGEDVAGYARTRACQRVFEELLGVTNASPIDVELVLHLHATEAEIGHGLFDAGVQVFEAKWERIQPSTSERLFATGDIQRERPSADVIARSDERIEAAVDDRVLAIVVGGILEPIDHARRETDSGTLRIEGHPRQLATEQRESQVPQLVNVDREDQHGDCGKCWGQWQQRRTDRRTNASELEPAKVQLVCEQDVRSQPEQEAHDGVAQELPALSRQTVADDRRQIHGHGRNQRMVLVLEDVIAYPASERAVQVRRGAQIARRFRTVTTVVRIHAISPTRPPGRRTGQHSDCWRRCNP